MDLQDKDSLMTESEKKYYFLGAFVFAGLFLSTFIFGWLVDPLRLLQFRLSILGEGFIYYLVLYFYYNVSSNKKTNGIMEGKKDEIIVCFNGRELGRW
ncbi:hypothetical protein [Alkalihalobacillus sp. AL-G]|uniref:hypothetical protein n=1 Tax=Alkalihalobacillus sp. AL-G TaxID=2926399 RepID=UPI00272AD840|nr:hypothetical protein [Alkalihalobacillus sp. AL-G]WLD93806.1 hypothetical protein MOJ78_02500 [Alkalihalobacillus sp. AL-G]